MRLLVLVTGQTIPAIAERRGDFPRWIGERTGDAWPGQWAVHDVRTDDALPGPEDADAFVITGSSSSVTERAPWMLRIEARIRELVAANVPLLGICFGHQLLAQALGGEVARNPRGREIGTVSVRRVGDDPLFGDLPRSFDIHATHVDAVQRLPDGAVRLAETDLDPNAAFRVGSGAWGVQFHPEFDADVMRAYLVARSELIRGEGGDPDALLAGVREHENGAVVLRAFAALAGRASLTRRSRR
jgi:GMP synthase (glutamine-hydrolysing)